MKMAYVAPLAAACLVTFANAALAKDVVKVSDFGCDAEDATRFVQAALDSGADSTRPDELLRAALAAR